MVIATAEQIGALIRNQVPAIMEAWEDSVRREIPAARAADMTALHLCLPELMTEIAREVEHGQEPAFARRLKLAQVHGAERAMLPDYSLLAVILEYRILRKALFAVLERQITLPPAQRDVIADLMEDVMQEAAGEYMAHAQQLSLSDQHKSTLLAMVAHEIRTPLGAVRNALYVLEHSPLDERGKRQVEAANRQIRQIGRIVEDLMDITSIAEGKVALRMAPLTIENIIQDAITTVLPFLESRNQSITSSITSHGIVINGDADRLEQIMLNLLNNAAKYTETGGRIWVTLAAEGVEAVIRVKDTGIGIDPVALPKIFDMFHQVSPSTISAEGMGIGLGVVKRLAELHGGQVSVESQGLGKGSEFTLRLPISVL
jgi:signal transduction histidine kinase